METILKAHGDNKEIDDKLLKEYIRLTSQIWSDIENIEAELKDILVHVVEPWKKTLYATRHKVLYPYSYELTRSILPYGNFKLRMRMWM